MPKIRKKDVPKNVYKLNYTNQIFKNVQPHVGKCVAQVVIKFQESKLRIRGFTKQ